MAGLVTTGPLVIATTARSPLYRRTDASAAGASASAKRTRRTTRHILRRRNNIMRRRSICNTPSVTRDDRLLLRVATTSQYVVRILERQLDELALLKLHIEGRLRSVTRRAMPLGRPHPCPATAALLAHLPL